MADSDPKLRAAVARSEKAGGGPRPEASPAPADGLLEQALRSLAAVARAELGRRPEGHLANRPGTRLELSLELPLDADPRDEDLVAVRESLSAELDALLAHRAAFRLGRVPSLRTGKAEGKETVPPDSRFVFGGWTPTGVPRFLDFGQWLLQLGHPHQDRLYRRPPGLVTALTDGESLLDEVLPDFRDTPTDFRVHGQVAAGWWPIPRADGTPATLALTFQAVSSARGRRGRRQFGLNILGAGPDGEPLEEVYARLDPLPWKEASEWARQALATLEHGQGRQKRSSKATKGRAFDERALDERIGGILGGLARRLEQKRRSRDRRTGHAESRHRSGQRPTRMAVEDLGRANDDQLWIDERKGTRVVLGDRGRTHFFNESGKLVTSVRYSPDAIARKKKAEIWRPATPSESAALRQRVAASAGSSLGRGDE